MVTTRSHDKGADGKTLALRSRSTPSPSPSLKRSNITVEISPPSKRLKREAGDATDLPVGDANDSGSRPETSVDGTLDAEEDVATPKAVDGRLQAQDDSVSVDGVQEDDTIFHTPLTSKPKRTRNAQQSTPYMTPAPGRTNGSTTRSKSHMASSAPETPTIGKPNTHKRFASEEPDDTVAVDVPTQEQAKNEVADSEDEDDAPEVINTKSTAATAQAQVAGSTPARGRKKARTSRKTKPENSAQQAGPTAEPVSKDEAAAEVAETEPSVPAIEAPAGHVSNNVGLHKNTSQGTPGHPQTEHSFSTTTEPQLTDSDLTLGRSDSSLNGSTATPSAGSWFIDSKPDIGTLLRQSRAMKLSSPEPEQIPVTKADKELQVQNASKDSPANQTTTSKLPTKSTGSLREFQNRMLGRHRRQEAWTGKRARFVKA